GALIDQGLAFEIVAPGDTGLFKVDPELIATLDRLLDDAAGALDALSEVIDTTKPEDLPKSTLTPRELADLAFIGRSELRLRRDELDRAANKGSGWAIASEADRAAARMVRALIPAEASLREQLGLDPRARRYFDLDDALAIRRRFVDFYLTAHRFDVSTDGDLGAALRHLAKRIDALRSSNIYPYLRVDDRLEIRAVQKRILAELDRAEPDHASRRRLWQDAVGFFELLMQINRREELRDHDWREAARLARELAAPTAPDPLPIDLVDELTQFAAQNKALDAFLLSREPIRPKAVAGLMNDLRVRLERQIDS
ncbi:MAG: hypothetical protein AAGE94_24010, partial [Acidobacteriota bacterium]